MPEKENIYTIRAALDKKTHRDIAVRGEQTLSKLAEAIVESYDFDFDHAYGFYNNINDLYASTEQYELFADMGEAETPDIKGVKKTKIQDVFQKGRKMLFLFDYGDEWLFLTECLDIKPSESAKGPPVVVGSHGQAPEQYPAGDEEDS